MNQKLLSCTPRSFLCPYCGKWHEWDEEYGLAEKYEAQLICSNAPSDCDEGDYRIYFYDGFCYYSIDSMCELVYQSTKGRIPISSIIESKDKPIVTFEVPITARSNDAGSHDCLFCNLNDKCIHSMLRAEGDERDMIITLGFEFKQSDYDKFAHAADLDRKENELKEREQAIDGREQTLKEREDAVTSKEQISQRPQLKENKEDTTMANNIFNMNLEFGPNKDENIASTLMGVAVKNGDSWRIYDKKKEEITDVGDMQLGNLPIFILPTTKLSEGDLIKDSGEYYFVTKVATSKTPTQTLSARTGEVKSVVPIKNVLGFSCYSKVIALSDSLNMGDDFDVEKLAIMSAMCGQTGENGGQMNQLIPLILFKDKFGGDDNTMKLLLMSSMMTSKDDDQMNQLLPLMFFKDKLGGDDDTMKLLLMSSTMGGNMAGSNNQLMSYLMLDALMDKKDDKAPQTGDDVAK